MEEYARDVTILSESGIEPSIPLLWALISESCKPFPGLSSPGPQKKNFLLLPITTKVAKACIGNPTILALLITHGDIKLCFTGFLSTKSKKLHHYIRNDRKAADLSIQKWPPQIIQHTQANYGDAVLYIDPQKLRSVLPSAKGKEGGLSYFLSILSN